MDKPDQVILVSKVLLAHGSGTHDHYLYADVLTIFRLAVVRQEAAVYLEGDGRWCIALTKDEPVPRTGDLLVLREYYPPTKPHKRIWRTVRG